jgi:hypothetical protein
LDEEYSNMASHRMCGTLWHGMAHACGPFVPQQARDIDI